MNIVAITNAPKPKNNPANKRILFNKNQLSFGVNYLKFADDISDSATTILKKTNFEPLNIKQSAKKKADISDFKKIVGEFKTKIKKSAKGFGESIKTFVHKQKDDTELSIEEEALAVFNKGPRDVNASKGQDKAINEIQKDFEAGNISSQEKNRRIAIINGYYDKAKKLPQEVSSTQIIKNQPKFSGSQSEFQGPPPGHSARMAQSQSAQQCMQSHMNGMSPQEFIIYKEFIEKNKKGRRY